MLRLSDSFRVHLTILLLFSLESRSALILLFSGRLSRTSTGNIRAKAEALAVQEAQDCTKSLCITDEPANTEILVEAHNLATRRVLRLRTREYTLTFNREDSGVPTRITRYPPDASSAVSVLCISGLWMILPIH